MRTTLKSVGYADYLIPTEFEERFRFTLDQPITLTDEDVMVTADWHIPVYNPWLVNDMINRSRTMGIKTLIIAGDLWNFDALSAYDPKQESAGLARENDEVKNVMRTLTKTFDKIKIVWGNHDARGHKALGFKMKFAQAMWTFLGYEESFLETIEISNLDHLYVDFTDAEVRRWRVCHPAQYSRVPLATPRAMAAKYGTNVICAHAHHAAIGHGVDGNSVAVEIGGLFDAAKTAYLQRSTTFPLWQPGYGWFKDGRFHMTTPTWET